MDRRPLRCTILTLWIIFSLSACTLPGFSTPHSFFISDA